MLLHLSLVLWKHVTDQAAFEGAFVERRYKARHYLTTLLLVVTAALLDLSV